MFLGKERRLIYHPYPLYHLTMMAKMARIDSKKKPTAFFKAKKNKPNGPFQGQKTNPTALFRATQLLPKEFIIRNNVLVCVCVCVCVRVCV